MKFNCGLTNEEWEKRHREWHRFFPIWPRTVQVVNGENVCAWLEPIERRALNVWHQYNGRLVIWEYRPIDRTAKEI